MKCPSCKIGRLECRSTRDAPTPGRTLRYRYCRRCGAAYPTIETVLRINSITSPPAPSPPPK
jgi:transcriptional regulator NrdR family protein